MQIIERTGDRLVIVQHAWRLSCAVVVMAIAVAAGIWNDEPGLRAALVAGPGFLMLFAWFLHYRVRFVLERGRNRLRHEVERIGRHRVRDYTASELVSVTLRTPPASSDNPSYLVQLTMRDGTSFWLFPSTHPREKLQELVDAIRELAGLAGKTTLDDDARALAAAGDVIGAVSLLRTELGLSLVEAKQRVDGYTDKEPSAGASLEALVRGGRFLKAVRLLMKSEGLTRKQARERVSALRKELTGL